MEERKLTLAERKEQVKHGTWHITEENGKEFDYSFGQLCTYFGFKYKSLYFRYVMQGMDITDAVEACRTNPVTWGATYSNGTIARGVWDTNKPFKKVNK